jgi:hypothetical protein
MSLTKATFSMIDGAAVNVLDYGADATGVADSTTAFQSAIDSGSNVFIPPGEYKITSTLTISTKIKIVGTTSSVLQFSTTTGSCIYINNGTSEIENVLLENFVIVDDSLDRENTYTLAFDRVAKSNFRLLRIEPSANYASNYPSLNAAQKQALKFGIRVGTNSYTNFIQNCLLSRAKIQVEMSDNHIIDNVIWSNERDFSIYLITASTMIAGNQIIPGVSYGIYSDAADITNTQINNNYFDGNTSLQSVIPTGDAIHFAGNFRRGTISLNRFFVIAKKSINVLGTLKAASIVSNFFSNCGSADLGDGDIYIGNTTGATIVGNAFFRDNLAQKTGVARAQPPQPPITVNAIGSAFDEPTFVSMNAIEGTNSYGASVYPASSAVLVKDNHEKIKNTGTFVTRYSDDEELLCFQQSTLTSPELDALLTGEIYTSSLFSLSIAPVTDPSGYISTVRLQDSTDLAVLAFGKQTVITDTNNYVYVRTLKSGVWSSWKQVY